MLKGKSPFNPQKGKGPSHKGISTNSVSKKWSSVLSNVYFLASTSKKELEFGGKTRLNSPNLTQSKDGGQGHESPVISSHELDSGLPSTDGHGNLDNRPMK